MELFISLEYVRVLQFEANREVKSSVSFQRVLHFGGLTLKHSRLFHHSPVWRSPLIPIVVEQTVSVSI